MKWWKQLAATAKDYFNRRWWRLIEITKAEHPDDLIAQVAALEEKLARMPARQIRKFVIFYYERIIQAYQPELWYVAKIITSNFDDNSFLVLTYFLILNGKETFTKTLKSPELLAKLKLPTGVNVETVRGFAGKAYLKKTGKKPDAPTSFARRLAEMRSNIRAFAKVLPDLENVPRFQELKEQFWKPDVAKRKHLEMVQRFLPIHERLAEDGYVRSQVYLGCNFWLGKTVPQDMEKAVKYLRSAAYKNVHLAQACLGAIYFKGVGVPQDYRTAADWYRQAADQGYASAQRELGQLYRRGQGAHRDYSKPSNGFSPPAKAEIKMVSMTLACCI
jgi:TPR repeat protein